MRFTVLAYGTRGEIQPCLPVAEGLQRKGHEILFATHRRYQKLVEDCGLAYKALAFDPLEWLASPEGQSWQSSRNPFSAIARLRRLLGPRVIDVFADASAACENAE